MRRGHFRNAGKSVAGLPVPSAVAAHGEFDVAAKVPTALCPLIVVKGQRFHALAHDVAPLPARVLWRAVANVAAQAHVLVSAIDAVLSGI
jgi:toxin CcdB